MPAVFRPRANLILQWALLAAAGLCLLTLGGLLVWPTTAYHTRVGWIVDQPVPFSHQHHVSGLGIDCRFCHAAVEVSSNAGMPSTHVCMTCHSQIWTNADLLAPVRDSLAHGTPLVWNRITNLPDYVYFNHAIHVAKGVGCASCHGDVAQMALTAKARSLSMDFCLTCHRNPAPQLRPAGAIYDTGWHRTADTPSPAVLLAQYHLGNRNLADCSICHR